VPLLTESAAPARTESPSATSRLAPVKRLAIAWHLCSLDAPSVAALWTWFIARSAHLALPATSIAAMFLAVWILYAADRLLDARLLDAHTPAPPHLEARHLFHFRNRRAFRVAIVLASAALAPLLLTIPPEALHLYLIAGSLLIAWFLLIHIAPSHLGHEPHRLPKELAVGAFFAAATFIPTVSRAPQLRTQLLLPALLFAALCGLNCLFIYAWEHTSSTHSPQAHPTTRIALRHLPQIAATILLAALVLACAHPLSPSTPISLAIALAAGLLLTLHRTQAHIHPRTFLRAAADLALLTPILLLPFLR
jgi:hypothetical protein